MPPPNYLELKAQIDELQKRADEVRKNEIPEVIATIRRLMADYGIGIDDLAGRKGGRSEQLKAARYQDPATGKTWSGTGRQPRWFTEAIASGKQAEDFLITKTAAIPTPAASTTAKPAVARKGKAVAAKKGKSVTTPVAKTPTRKGKTTRKRAATVVAPSDAPLSAAQEGATTEPTTPA